MSERNRSLVVFSRELAALHYMSARRSVGPRGDGEQKRQGRPISICARRYSVPDKNEKLNASLNMMKFC